ncbi:MAG: hypothetical protein AAFR61_24490 [Bacteroidota bacterium]
MDSIKALQTLLDQLKDKDLQGLTSQKAMDALEAYSERYQELYDYWMQEVKAGKEIPLEKMGSLLEAVSAEMKQQFTRPPSPKMPHPFYMIRSFRQRLAYLTFERDKRLPSYKNQPCHCALRLAHGIEPDFPQLIDYGRAVLYHDDENFLIKRCPHCGTKWIDATVPGMLSMSQTWREWDPMEYVLREVFADKKG